MCCVGFLICDKRVRVSRLEMIPLLIAICHLSSSSWYKQWTIHINCYPFVFVIFCQKKDPDRQMGKLNASFIEIKLRSKVQNPRCKIQNPGSEKAGKVMSRNLKSNTKSRANPQKVTYQRIDTLW